TIILTIALTVGVNRILRKGGLVRNMQAGEALGAATVICTDKTGTLTRGDMRAEAFYMPQGEQVTLNQPPRGPVQALALIGLALASDAHRARPDALKYLGSATERSALEFVEKFGFNQQKLREKWRRRDSITFSSVWKYRASLHDHPTNETRTLFVSGAPDVLLARSSQTINDRDEIVGISGKCRQELEAEIKKMAAAGTRILAVALRSNMRKDNITHRDVNNLTFAGVLTITDPIREEVRQAVWETKSAGIAVKLVTGDYEPTARGVAHQLGLGATDEEVLSGEILESLSDQELAEAVGAVNVFARVSPLDKKRIVRALQKQGEVVAMTGDGVNDAVALKTADIGVAMGSGKDVAKDAADLVLLDDNFATIVAAIKEGRVVRDNIRKVIAFLLSTNMAEVAIFIASFLARMPLPLLPAQILWINLVTDGTSDMALALEKQESDVMKRGPERPDAPLIDRELFLRIFWAGLALTAATMGIYWYLWHVMQADLAYVRTMTFTFLAVASLLSTWSYRSLKGSMFKKGLRHNWWLFVSAGFSISLQLAAIYVPALQKFFGTVPLYRNDWLVVLAVAVMTVILIESRKLIKVPDKRLPRLRLWPRMRPHRTSHNYD
ncbi:MAG: HAD-IC family P-type ATPase, partial [Candidatus Andersenbacteria bacterium]|nr:HAD-IC family P-type ATPase [Candidatus Andersenbacteria bacterium]